MLAVGLSSGKLSVAGPAIAKGVHKPHQGATALPEVKAQLFRVMMFVMIDDSLALPAEKSATILSAFDEAIPRTWRAGPGPLPCISHIAHHDHCLTQVRRQG